MLVSRFCSTRFCVWVVAFLSLSLCLCLCVVWRELDGVCGVRERPMMHMGAGWFLFTREMGEQSSLASRCAKACLLVRSSFSMFGVFVSTYMHGTMSKLSNKEKEEKGKGIEKGR